MDVPMVVMSKRIGFPIPKLTILMAINHQSVWVVYDIAVLTLSGLLTHGLLMSSGIPNNYLRSKTFLIIPSMLSKKKVHWYHLQANMAMDNSSPTIPSRSEGSSYVRNCGSARLASGVSSK
jgi:hypothetical protein